MWRSVRSGGPPVAGGLQRTSRESVRRMLHCLSRQAKRPITTRPSDKPTRKSPSSSGRTCATGLLLPVSMQGAAKTRAAQFHTRGTLCAAPTRLRGTAPVHFAPRRCIRLSALGQVQTFRALSKNIIPFWTRR